MTTSLSSATLKTGHIGLSVTDLDRSLPFYARVFGFETLAEGKEDSRRWAFLGRGEEIVVTLWQQSEDGFATGTMRPSPPLLPGRHSRGDRRDRGGTARAEHGLRL